MNDIDWNQKFGKKPKKKVSFASRYMNSASQGQGRYDAGRSFSDQYQSYQGGYNQMPGQPAEGMQMPFSQGNGQWGGNGTNGHHQAPSPSPNAQGNGGVNPRPANMPGNGFGAMPQAAASGNGYGPGQTWEPRGNGNGMKDPGPPVFEGPQIHGETQGTSARWRYRDLKNRKQIGDLYKTILNFTNRKKCSSFCFTSSRAGEGVSTILANLAAYINTYAAGKKVLLIDANLSFPSLNRIFNVPPKTYGLVEILMNQADILGAVTGMSPGISVLFSGNTAAGRNIGLDEENFSKILSYYKSYFDLILIDCPPVLSSSDSLSVAPSADVIFLVLQAAKVQRPVAERAKTLLENSECRFGGIILNRVTQVIPGWVYKFI